MQPIKIKDVSKLKISNFDLLRKGVSNGKIMDYMIHTSTQIIDTIWTKRGI